MLLPGLSLNDQNTLNASRGVSDTNAATLFTEGQSSIDGFTTYNRSYDFANYSLQNLDYNISTSRGYAGSVINYWDVIIFQGIIIKLTFSIRTCKFRRNKFKRGAIPVQYND